MGALERALDRYVAETQQTPESADAVLNDPRFMEIYEEEVRADQTGTSPATRSDSRGTGCPDGTGPASSEPCNFSILQINKANDSDRVYRSNQSVGDSISFVAGRNVVKANVQFRLTGTEGPCSQHNNHIWDFNRRHITVTTENNTSLDAGFIWSGNADRLGFFNHGIQPSIYNIACNTHRNSKRIQVKVYPDYSWSGTVTFSSRINPDTNAIEFDDTTVTFSRTDDGRTSNFGGSITDFLRLIRNFYRFLNGVKEITDFVSQATVRWQPVPPSFSISINTRWQENPTNLDCGYYINFSLGFTPLIGLQLNIVLSNVAIAAIPYVGALIVRAAGRHIERYVAITFTISGTINGTFNYSKETTEPSGRASGSVSGVLSFDFQIRGQVNRDFSFFVINCGIRGGARTSVTITGSGPNLDSSGLYLGLGATFDGLTLYYGAYCRAGTTRDTRIESGSSAPGASDENTYPWVAARDLIEQRRLRL